MTRYALLIGVDYPNNLDPDLSPLLCTGGNVTALKLALLNNGYDESNIDDSIGNLESEVVQAKIEALFTNKQPDDVCFFYFSGHGLPSEVGDHTYLAMSNTQKEKLKSTAISAHFLCDVMKDCRAKQVVIVDCCFSGKVAEAIHLNCCAALLVSSTGLQYSHAGKGEISPYTQYLVKGIESGLTIIRELHEYIVTGLQKVNITDMTPKIYPFLEGYNILLIASNQEKKKFNFSFKNRKDEIKMIEFLSDKIFIIDAAAGYGKSALLMEIKRIYSEKQWNCHYIDFRTQRIAEIIKSNLINQVISRNSCLLFDAIEELENSEEIQNLINIIHQCDKGGAKKLKIILAGRYIRSKYRSLNSEGFKFISLRNFNKDIVFSFIKEIWKEESKESKEKSKESEESEEKPVMWGDCAKYILSLSAGHPKCTEILVNEFAKNGFSIEGFKKKESFNAYVEPQIEEILLPLGDNIRQYIELLFIFRSFNFNILKALQNNSLISDKISVLDIINELYPFVHSELVIEYSIDKIVRKLLLERMKLFEPLIYNKLNHLAQLIYDELIKKPPHFYNKDKDEEIRQLKVWEGFLLQESIYHATQRLFDKKFQENDLVQCVRQSQVALAKKWCEDENSLECRLMLKNILEDIEINETLKEKLNDYDKDQFVNRIFNAE